MTTLWDRAVRALQPITNDVSTYRDEPLAYYCGGPARHCTHKACEMVSALAGAGLLDYAPVRPVNLPNDQTSAMNVEIRASESAVDVAEETAHEGHHGERSDDRAAYAAMAHVHATLALVHEQRIANMHAADNVDEMHRIANALERVSPE